MNDNPISRRAVLHLVPAGLALSAFGCATAPPAPIEKETAASGFIPFTTTVDGDTRPSVVYVPEGYDPAKKWPLIVFLHGSGEGGSDGTKQTAVGIGPEIVAHPDRFPCLVLMPQSPAGASWSPRDPRPARQKNENSAHLTAAIEHVIARYNVDEDRVSLTGLSLGGLGSFLYGADTIERWSAIMPICGAGVEADAPTLAKAPIWVFHGADDPVVSPDFSRKMVAALKAAGANVKYTEYPGTGHNSWVQAYADPEAIAWLLAQKRR